MQNGKRDIRNAEIVTIGTEMLLGDLVDTKTAWMSQPLAGGDGGRDARRRGARRLPPPPAAAPSPWTRHPRAGLGVGIYRHTTVGDNTDRIVGALRDAA